MSKIQERIKELEKVQKKIDFLSYIRDTAKSVKDPKFSDIKNDMIEVISNFVDKAIDDLESGNEIDISNGSKLEKDEVELVKKFVDKVKSGAGKKKDHTPDKSSHKIFANEPDNNEETPPEQYTHHEKMQFSMSHRHLGHKLVHVTKEDGSLIEGRVVGLDKPHVWVQDNGGAKFKVTPDKLILKE